MNELMQYLNMVDLGVMKGRPKLAPPDHGVPSYSDGQPSKSDGLPFIFDGPPYIRYG